MPLSPTGFSTVPLFDGDYFLLKQHHEFFQVWRDAKILRLLILSTLMMGLGWGLYVRCVQNDRIVESSLGYYLTPVLNVMSRVTLIY